MKTLRAAFVVAMLALGVLMSASVVHAQSDAQQARALFEEGRAASTEERWVDALSAFERSRAILERPSTVFNLAAVLVRLGRARDALHALDDLDRIADARRDRAVLEQARPLRTTAEQSLRHVVLRVSPAEARIEVDGVVLEETGAERSTILDPGAHAIVVSLDGYREERFELPVGTDARDVSLAPLDATLVVTSTVDAATIAIDGAPRGVGHVQATVSPGGHLVTLDAEGYVPFERRVDVAPGASMTVEAALEPIAHEESLVESPLFWGLTGAGVAVVAAVIIGVAVATAGTEPAYGGSSNVVLAPLVSF